MSVRSLRYGRITEWYSEHWWMITYLQGKIYGKIIVCRNMCRYIIDMYCVQGEKNFRKYVCLHGISKIFALLHSSVHIAYLYDDIIYPSLTLGLSQKNGTLSSLIVINNIDPPGIYLADDVCKYIFLVKIFVIWFKFLWTLIYRHITL